MPLYDDITPDQSDFLLKLVTFAQEKGTSCFVHGAVLGPDGGYLFGETKNAQIFGMPISDVFYTGLAAKDYLNATWTQKGSLQIGLTRRAYDYFDYMGKRRLHRWYRDFKHDLGHDDTLRSKIIWATVAVVLANLVNVLLRLVGLLP